MTEQELLLLHKLRDMVKAKPELFGQAVMFMNDGVNEAIQEAKSHAMQMEKLAFAFHAANSLRHTTKTKEWVDKMVGSVQTEMKYFPVGE